MIDLTVTKSSLLVRLMFFLDYQLPTRPGLGTQGRQIRLRSNFYELKNFADEIIHYDVKISDGRTENNFPKDLNLLIIETCQVQSKYFQKKACV